MTPPAVAETLVESLSLPAAPTVLEPSFGDGSFLIPLIERLLASEPGDPRERFEHVMRENLFGVELDEDLYTSALAAITRRFGPLPANHHLHCGDFFRTYPSTWPAQFDLIIGNPPFGGTFDAEIEDTLDRQYGSYGGHKLKKETYSFFVAKSIGHLTPRGQLLFICSDTFLTIKTMRGLRELLIDSGEVSVNRLPAAFATVTQPMVVLDLRKGESASSVTIHDRPLLRSAMAKTGNFSWGLDPGRAPLFDGPHLAEFIVASGGMTIGRNDLFVREIQADGTIIDPYSVEFFERPITLERELECARLHRLSEKMRARIREREERGETRRAVRVVERDEPVTVDLPHPDYLPYNKASSERFYSAPTHAVYWRDNGDAVLTFKRDGPWYLHGVGGKPYFGREGLSWQLVAPKLKARYLPPGYILDSGAPCAFLRDGVDATELYVILAWLQTELATTLLKTVINHTRNIQGKDVERLPYPFWTPLEVRAEAARLGRDEVDRLMAGEPGDPTLVAHLDELFDPNRGDLTPKQNARRIVGSTMTVRKAATSPQLSII
jgi:N-6 DNA Methylase